MPKASDSEGKAMPKNGRQVRHAAKACTVCQERKGRCENDGLNPCKWCVSKNQDCTYRTSDGRVAAPNKQAVEASKLLLDNLQAENEALRRYIRTLIPASTSPPSITNGTSSTSTRDSSKSSQEPATTDADVEALADQARHLVLQDDRLALHGIWSPFVNIAPSLPARRSASLMVDDEQPTSVPEHQAINPINYREAVYAIPGAWRKFLPEKAIIDKDEHLKVVQLFLQTFAAWGMRIVPQLFWRDMYRALQPNAPECSQRTAHWSPFLHNTLLSVALTFSDRPEVRSRSNRELFAKAAKAQMDQECMKPEISTVTGFSFLGSFHSGQNEHGLGFTYFGISVRMCRSLGLNVDCSQWVRSGNITKSDARDRLWGFWKTYGLDIWWALYVGREFSINLANVTIPLPDIRALPSDDTLWTYPETDDTPRPHLYAECFTEVCKLTLIITKIMDAIYGLDRRGYTLSGQLLHQLNIELNNWYINLPKPLKSISKAMPHVYMMHLAFWWSLILLHRPTYSHNPNKESVSRKLCLRAAREVIKIAGLWQSRYGLKYVPVTVMTVIYTAGTTWLIAVSETAHKKETKLRFLEQAEKCVEYLKETGTYWETGAHLEGLLKGVVAKQRAKLDGSANAPRNKDNEQVSNPRSESPTTTLPINNNSSDSPSIIPLTPTPSHNTMTNFFDFTQGTATPPETILQEYFAQSAQPMEGITENDLFSNLFGDLSNSNIPNFAFNNPTHFGSLAPSSSAFPTFQQPSTSFPFPSMGNQPFSQDMTSNTAGFGSNLDWTSLFGDASSTSVDVDMINLMGHSELGMPAGGEFPLGPSSHIPGIYSSPQMESDWFMHNILLK